MCCAATSNNDQAANGVQSISSRAAPTGVFTGQIETDAKNTAIDQDRRDTRSN
jgi:hypothetical protein